MNSPRRPTRPPSLEELPVKVSVVRDFSHPPARIFDAWTKPELIQEWMFGPPLREETVQGISVAARVGGTFSFRVLRNDQLLDHAGRYLEVVHPHRLAFTWGIKQYLPESSRVALDIVPISRGARLLLTHAMPADAEQFADQTRTGWETMLEVMDSVLDETDSGEADSGEADSDEVEPRGTEPDGTARGE